MVRYLTQYFVPLPEQSGGGFSKEAQRLLQRTPALTGGLALEALS